MGDVGDYVVDHINGDPLDNRRENLRVATRNENCRNRRRRKRYKYRFKGVTYDKDKVVNKWRARISYEGKRHCLGYFYTETEAAKAYNEAAIRLHGEFASLNVIAG
ncbi:HNH endonuclease [Paenibacillus alvei]|uniref:HNH endonuclease n=1 Tax=Paenibacillus alvei TaxID=44250 RepID=UPI003990CBCB